ncbi:MAG: hypothetical protein LUE27_09935 [Clostridia bacterium]|nr:hypothetical protein [Clostridia bacterium]
MASDRITSRQWSVGENKVFLTVENGSIVYRADSGTAQDFKSIEGYVEGISQTERTFSRNKPKLWHIDIRNKLTRQLYTLTFPYTSGAFMNIVLQLGSDKGINAIMRRLPVKIEVCKSRGGDRAMVSYCGERLDSAESRIPPIEYTTVDGERVKDSSRRMECVSYYADNIRLALMSREGFKYVN